MSVPEPDETSTVPGMHIWGWMSEEDLSWLAERAAKMSSIVEVGSLHGRSSFALATACPGPVYCIDPGIYETSWMVNLASLPNAIPVAGLSPGAAWAEEMPSEVDMTFIDGAHDAESVTADLHTWEQRTRVLLCGHDWDHADYPDVTREVTRWFGDEVKVAPGTGIWYVEL